MDTLLLELELEQKQKQRQRRLFDSYILLMMLASLDTLITILTNIIIHLKLYKIRRVIVKEHSGGVNFIKCATSWLKVYKSPLRPTSLSD